MLLLLAIAILLFSLPILIYALERRKSRGKLHVRPLIYSVLGIVIASGLIVSFFLYDPMFHPIL